MNTHPSHTWCPYCGAPVTPTAWRCQSCGNLLQSQPGGNPHSQPTRVDYGDFIIEEQQGTSPDTSVNTTIPRPQAPTPKKSNTGLWVALCAAGTLFVFGIVFLILTMSKHPAPQGQPAPQPMISDNRSRPGDAPNPGDVKASPSAPAITGAVWLMDLVNRDNLSERIRELHLGDGFPATYTTHGGYRVYGKGFISHSDVMLDAYLEPNGEIHGRYTNEKNIRLDANGYMDRNGNIRIQLGHGAETSYWTLYHQSGFFYRGPWGKKELPSALTFELR